MSAVEGWLEFLKRKQIHYSHSVHRRAETARQTAAAECMPVHELSKTVVYFSNAGYGIAAIAAGRRVDLAKVASVLGLSRIRLASEAELTWLFPSCEPGAMPPFGDDCGLPVIVDPSVVREHIAFTIGTHRDLVRMRFEDFERLAKPCIADIAAAETEVLM
jgi:Ala-tRNA(Pro) deacylase